MSHVLAMFCLNQSNFIYVILFLNLVNLLLADYQSALFDRYTAQLCTTLTNTRRHSAVLPRQQLRTACRPTVYNQLVAFYVHPRHTERRATRNRPEAHHPPSFLVLLLLFFSPPSDRQTPGRMSFLNPHSPQVLEPFPPLWVRV